METVPKETQRMSRIRKMTTMWYCLINLQQLQRKVDKEQSDTIELKANKSTKKRLKGLRST